MPLVFVHGVATRMSAGYQSGTANRDELFHTFLLAPHATELRRRMGIENVYWGDLGAKPAWNLASIPTEEFESLGTSDEPFQELYGASAAPSDPDRPADRAILDTARTTGLPAAVDLVWAAAALLDEDNAVRLAEGATAAAGYADANPQPAWLAEVDDDDEFLTRLQREVEQFNAGTTAATDAAGGEWETLGAGSSLWSTLRSGASRLRTAVTGSIGKSVSDRVRPALLPGLSGFLGDVFVYLHEQEADERPIGTRVGDALRAGAAERSDTDPLVVVAHSMGGNITYDLLTSTHSDVDVDLYVTVGTQIGLFEELKLFASSSDQIPGPQGDRVKRPQNIARWINVFDHSDLLGYEAGAIIEGVEDFGYRTGSLLHAHSQYFLQPGFHRRLAARVHDTPDDGGTP